MAKIEHGTGILLTIDTEQKTLRFKEMVRIFLIGEPAKEWEFPHALDWEDKQFFDLVGKGVDYVLSDGAVVSLKATSE